MTTTPPRFTWQVPTRACFGNGRARDLGVETAALGAAPAVVIDAALAESVTGTDLVRRLAAHRIPAVTVATIDGTPTLDDVRGVVGRVTSTGADVIVGIGGGSAMDTAKLAAVITTNPALVDDERWRSAALLDFDGDRDAALRPGLPTLLLPTTVATGSELNSVAAVTVAGRKRLMASGHLAPTGALIDPELTMTLPPRSLMEGGLETLARVVCPYLATDALDVTDALAETLSAQCLRALDGLHANPGDLSVHGELCWIVATSATQLVGLGRGRRDHVLWYLQDTLGTGWRLNKGTAMAALLPAYLRTVRVASAFGVRLGRPARLERLENALAPVLGAPLEDALAKRLTAWGLPRDLAELDLTAADVERLARDTHDGWSRTGRLAGVSLTELADFYHRARGAAASTRNQAFPSAASASPKGEENPMKGSE